MVTGVFMLYLRTVAQILRDIMSTVGDMLVIDSVRCLTCMCVGRDLDPITVWA